MSEPVKVKFRWKPHTDNTMEFLSLNLFVGKENVGFVCQSNRGYYAVSKLIIPNNCITKSRLETAKRWLIKRTISWFARCGIVVEEEK